jgi:hypothetical protein
LNFKDPARSVWPGRGSRHGSPGSRAFGNRLSRHRFFPIRPVQVFHHHGYWTTEGFPVSDTRQESNPVLFDLHSSATAIPALSPAEFTVYEFKIQPNIGRQALY